MSRRYSQDRTLDIGPEADPDAPWDHYQAAGIPWWYATEMPYPWDGYYWHQWLSAWAELTLEVCHSAYRRHGARLYATHRDRALRDDLQDWLIVRAVEAAKGFIPDPWHPNPHRQYAAWLHGHLAAVAPQHFAHVVGRSHRPSGQAAQNAHNSRIGSVEALEEMEAETGGFISRHPLHGVDPFTDNPEHIVIRMDELHAQVEKVEREDRRSGAYSTSTTVGQECLTTHCDRPAIARGLCRAHYQVERRKTQDNCSQDDCKRAVQARGLCSRHYKEHKAQAVQEGTWQPYDTPPGCTVQGCPSTKVEALGMCAPHYEAHRRATAPPCTVEGCDLRGTGGKGYCSTHYRRWRKARETGEGEAYL